MAPPPLDPVEDPNCYGCVAESTTRLPSSVINPSNCNNLRILLVYSRHIDCRVSWGHLRQTYCQRSLHLQLTLLLVGSHAAPPPFVTVFPHLYTLLTVSLVLGLSSRLTCSQDICSRFFARYKFVTYLLTYCSMTHTKFAICATVLNAYKAHQETVDLYIVLSKRIWTGLLQ